MLSCPFFCFLFFGFSFTVSTVIRWCMANQTQFWIKSLLNFKPKLLVCDSKQIIIIEKKRFICMQKYYTNTSAYTIRVLFKWKREENSKFILKMEFSMQQIQRSVYMPLCLVNITQYNYNYNFVCIISAYRMWKCAFKNVWNNIQSNLYYDDSLFQVAVWVFFLSIFSTVSFLQLCHVHSHSIAFGRTQ